MSIKFRCWYCHRRYSLKGSRVGEVLTCNCKNEIRVPKRDNGNCKIRTPLDWLVELVVCGGGGAFLGFCLALLIVGKFRFLGQALWLEAGLGIIANMVLVGGTIGAVGGIPGIELIGRFIRERETE